MGAVTPVSQVYTSTARLSVWEEVDQKGSDGIFREPIWWEIE